MYTRMFVKYKLIMVIFVTSTFIFSLLGIGNVNASSFNWNAGTTNDIKVVQNSAANSDIFIPSPHVNGLSVNDFNQFIVSQRKLTIYNGSRSSDSIVNNDIANVIVIKSSVISLADNIEIIGAPADIIFIGTSSNQKLTCTNCSFTNVGRVTFAAATVKSVSLIKSTGIVGELVTTSGGSVEVNGLLAPGLQAMELIADTVKTAGIIDINLKADIHPEGGHIVHSEGSKVVGSGGISLYSGRMTIDYEELKVTAATVVNQEFLVDGKIRAATIAVLSPKNIRLASTADLSTLSDVIATSTRNSQFYAPIEGIFIQGAGKHLSSGSLDSTTHKITVAGKLSSDNKVLIKSLSKLNMSAVVVAGELSLISGHNTHATGRLQAKLIEVAARNFINNGAIATSWLNIETEKSIYNSFGGNIKANQITLKANGGNVVNGSRSKYRYYPDTPTPLTVSADMTALKHGLYYQVTESGAVGSHQSASILGNEIYIQAKSVENINPYSLTKGASEDWSAGVSVKNSLARQVSIQAENRLEIKTSNYILNSSAIIGVNQAGLMVFNTPVLSNERYRLEVESFTYNQLDLSHDTSQQHDVAKVGTETKVVAYSPPARLYTFGEFRFSDGNANDSTSEEFLNEFSYFEVFGDSHFHQTLIKTIGIELAQSLSLSEVSKVRSCLNYGNCSGETTLTLADAETLFSIRGNLYGIDSTLPSQSDLVVDNINTYDALVQQLVDAYLAPFIYTNSEYDYGYVKNMAINDGYLEGSAIKVDGYTTSYIPAGPGYAIAPKIETTNIRKSIDSLLAEDAAQNPHPGTAYTPNQITVASRAYIETLDITYPEGYSAFYKEHNNVFSSYTLSDNDDVLITYREYVTYVRPQVGDDKYQLIVTVRLPLTELMTYLPN